MELPSTPKAAARARKEPAGGPTTLESRICAVTVYRWGARVTRIATLPAIASPRTVVIGGLPLALRDDSVRARIEPAATDLWAPDLRIVLDVPAVDDSLRPADDAELVAARREHAQLAVLVTQIERELGRVQELGLVPRPAGKEGEAPPPSPTASRLALLDLRDRQAGALFDELEQARERLARAERRRHELEDRDRRATTARRARESEMRKAAVVRLEPRGKAPAGRQLTIDYRVPGAQWAPAYAARLGRTGGSATIGLRAMVAQRTGEDWTAVALTLSTADPDEWTDLPELPSVRIGRAQPAPPALGWRPPPSGAGELYADYDAAFAEVAARPSPPPPPRPRRLETERLYATQEQAEDTIAGELPLLDVKTEIMDTVSRDELVQRSRAEPVMAPAAPAAASPMQSMLEPQTVPVAKGRGGAALIRRRPKTAMPDDMELGFGVDGELLADAPGGGPAATRAIRARPDLLAYADLRMPPARSRERGKLVVSERRQLYLSLLSERRIEVDFDVVGLVDAAVGAAEMLASRPPPGRHQLAARDRYDYAYTAEAAIDLPSDGDYHSVPLFTRPAEAVTRFVVVPRESTDVFRTAEIKNPLGAPLLGGPCDVYLDDQFLLTSELRFTAPDGVIKLGLGVEQAIKVARNARFEEDTAGLLGGTRTLRHSVDIRARNLLERPADLEVRERVPVAREGDEELRIEIGPVTPAWEAYDPFPERAGALRGGHRWRAQVAAGAEATFSLTYHIRIASKHELVGGNRREQ